LYRDSSVELSILINGYDDGLSTGTIRRILPGLLGPSDFRKNISNILGDGSNQEIFLSQLLERRLINPDLFGMTNTETRKYLMIDFFGQMKNFLTYNQFDELYQSLDCFFTYFSNSSEKLAKTVFNDMAFGNLLIAGEYLKFNQDFNSAIANLNKIFNLTANLFNVTEGFDCKLTALMKSGKILPNEASIVNLDSEDSIDRIFLLPNYLEPKVIAQLDLNLLGTNLDYLKDLEVAPKISNRVRETLINSDVIIYGPGTQHSSLLPSYLTSDIGQLISDNSNAKKIFIANLSEDNDIKNENLISILTKLRDYLNESSSLSLNLDKYVSHILINSSNGNTTSWGISEEKIISSSVTKLIADWSSNNLHSGRKIKSAIQNLIDYDSDISSRQSKTLTTLAIVIPTLNEKNFIGKALSDLVFYDWISLGYFPEFIVVDGGSIDGTREIARSFPNVKFLEVVNCRGRGEALTAGILKSNSDLIVTFPSDNEYSLESIFDILRIISVKRNQIIFGNRIGYYSNNQQRLRQVYEGNPTQYYLSKWGGYLLTILVGIFHRTWIADTLTSVKGFSSEVSKNIFFDGKSLDWDINLIIEAKKMNIPIAEIPVEYFPRNKKNGKKIRNKDGLRAIKRVLISKKRG
jgi:2-phospho-L-lactate transferase/gluconeogenesis factor (CofD/UPF0052 family)